MAQTFVGGAFEAEQQEVKTEEGGIWNARSDDAQGSGRGWGRGS